MGISMKEKRELILKIVGEIPNIFSNKIYSAMIQDLDISMLELFYDDQLQQCSLTDVYESLQKLKIDQSLINSNNIDQITWFEQKMNVLLNFRDEMALIYEQITDGSKIKEKLNEFYRNNQQNIENWYVANYNEFNDETNIQQLFTDRFEFYSLLNAPMRIINIIYSNNDIVQVLQSYHKDKIDLFYN